MAILDGNTLSEHIQYLRRQNTLLNKKIAGLSAGGTSTTIQQSPNTLGANISITNLPVKDEDNMSSNSDVHIATQQSIKAYADLMLPKAGGVMTGSLTVGVDDTGHDVKLFGATSGAYLLWDESADKLLTAGGAVIDIVKDKLLIGGTAVTTTAAELNVLDGYTGSVTELNYLDTLHATGVTATEYDYLDGVTSAIQTQLDAKLPLSGGAMTGAITTNSTFDGRDVSVDGAKLDGIEANATADQTNAEIRAAVEAASDSNVFTDADHTKLNGIATGAEVNVQSDWSSGSGDAHILNKPTIPSGNQIIDWTTDQGSTNIHVNNLTPVALTTVQTAANQSAMLALTTQEGDVVVRTDEKKSYMHNGGTAGDMNDFTLLQTPTDVVTSVNGAVGAVTLTHDGFSDFVANEHIDWTADQGSTNIHSGNYTDTNTNQLTTFYALDDDNDSKTIAQGKYIKFVSATGTAGTNWSGAGTSGDPWVMTITSPDTQTTNAIDGSGTANDVAMFSDSNTLTDAPIAISGDNATFAGNVDVNGTEITVGGTGSIFAENNIRFKSSGAAYIDHNTTSQSIIFRTSTSSSLDTTALTITNAGNATFAGNIGLGGATSPSRLLHIDNTSSTSTAGAYIYTNAQHTGADTQAHVSIRSDHASSTGDVLYVRGDGTGNLLTLDKGGSDKLVVDDDGNATFAGNILMGNTVVNPASGFSDQTGIGLKYSATVPELQVSSDSTALQLGRTSTGGSGQIMAMRAASTTVHDFRTTYYSTTGWVDAANFKIGGAQGSDGQVLTSTGSGVAWEAATSTDSTKMPLAGGTFTGDVTFDGANYHMMWDKSANALEFWDNAKLTFGDPGGSPNLELYHDGSHSYIDNDHTGDLYVRSLNDDVVIQAADDVFIYTQAGEDAIIARGNAAVELYYNNSKKLETSDAGATITGALTTTGNVTISSSINRSIILDYTSGSGGYSWMSFKQSGTEQFRVFGSYTGDYLSFYNDQNSVGHQLTLAATGEVGVGTDSPLAKLDVRTSGNTAIPGLDAAPGTSTSAIFRNSGNTVILATGVDNANTSWLQGRQKTGTGNAFPIALNPLGGNVGIGETTPDKKLDVYTATNTDGIRAWGPATNLALMLKNTGSNGSDWNIASTGGGHGYGDGSLQFGIAYGVPKVTFKSDGTVGIGTYAPDSLLHVQSTGSAVIHLENTGNAQARIQLDGDRSGADNNIGYLEGWWNGTSVAEIRFKSGQDTTNKDEGWIDFLTAPPGGTPASRMVIREDGDVGIGTASPAQQLHIQDNSGGGVILLERQDSSTSGTMGEILFGSRDYDDSLASIKAVMAGSTTSGKLVFSTEATGAALTTALTLNSDQSATFAGNVTASSGTGHFSNVNSSSYQLNGTYVMDSSRNLVNIAAITTTGVATFGDDGIINTANKALKIRYSTGSASHEGRLRWAGLQLGNNGTNRIVAGNTQAGGSLAIYTNNTNDGSDYNVTPDGAHAASFQADGDTILHQNVGIGTSSPGAKLNVFTGGNSIAAAAVLQHDTFATDRKVGLGFELGDTQIKAAVGFISDASSPGTHGRGNLIFCVDSNDDAAPVGHADEKMRITHAGKVGINIASPTSKLDVREDANNVYTAYFYNSATDANAHGINVQTATTNAGAYAFRVNSGSHSNALVVKGDANVGIGTSSPASYYGKKLVVVAPDENGITLLGTGANQKQYLCFADGTSGAEPYTGHLAYDHNDNTMVLATNGGAFALKLDSSQNATFAGTIISSKSTDAGIGGQLKLINPHNSNNVNEIVFQHRGSGTAYSKIESASVSGGDNTQLKFKTEGGGSIATRLTLDENGYATFAGKVIVSYANAALDLAQADGGAHFRMELDGGDETYLSTIGSNNMILRTNSNAALTLDTSQNATFAGRVVTGNTTIGNWSNSDRIETSGDELTLGTHSNHDVIIKRQASAALTFSSGTATFSGNVGFAGTTPSYHVDINRATNDGWLARFKNTGTAPYGIQVDTSGNASTSYTFAAYTAAEDFYIRNDGKVMIGTTTPGRMLSINGGTGNDGAVKLETTATASNFWSGVELKSPNAQSFIYMSADDTAGTIKFVPAGTVKAHINATSFVCAGDVVAYGSPSDISLKENIQPINNALDKVSKLKGITFDWKESDSLLKIKEDIGFIAQDVQKVLPDLVRENDDGKLSLRDKGIIPVLVEAIKELEARVKELENK